MATGTVKWFNDAKGFGSSHPTAACVRFTVVRLSDGQVAAPAHHPPSGLSEEVTEVFTEAIDGSTRFGPE